MKIIKLSTMDGCTTYHPRTSPNTRFHCYLSWVLLWCCIRNWLTWGWFFKQWCFFCGHLSCKCSWSFVSLWISSFDYLNFHLIFIYYSLPLVPSPTRHLTCSQLRAGQSEVKMWLKATNQEAEQNYIKQSTFPQTYLLNNVSELLSVQFTGTFSNSCWKLDVHWSPSHICMKNINLQLFILA